MELALLLQRAHGRHRQPPALICAGLCAAVREHSFFPISPNRLALIHSHRRRRLPISLSLSPVSEANQRLAGAPEEAGWSNSQQIRSVQALAVKLTQSIESHRAKVPQTNKHKHPPATSFLQAARIINCVSTCNWQSARKRLPRRRPKNTPNFANRNYQARRYDNTAGDLFSSFPFNNLTMAYFAASLPMSFTFRHLLAPPPSAAYRCALSIQFACPSPRPASTNHRPPTSR